MGRKATITENDVLAAIHKIRTTGVAGGAISAKNIRKITGTGSLTTIVKLLKSIEQNHPDLFLSPTESETSSPSVEIETYLCELKDKVDFLPKLFLQVHHVNSTASKKNILQLEQKIDELQEVILSRDKEIERLNMLIKESGINEPATSDTHTVRDASVKKIVALDVQEDDVSKADVTDTETNPSTGKSDTSPDTVEDKKRNLPRKHKNNNESSQLPLFGDE